jgi:transposase
VLGADAFAVARGRRYGTVLVDPERRRPVGVLPDRGSAAFAGWLRDRGGSGRRRRWPSPAGNVGWRTTGGS